MLIGLEKLLRTVAVTLGPYGRNSIIQSDFKTSKITGDGVTIVKNLILRNRTQETSNYFIKQSANRSNLFSGDGTTTTTILSCYLVKECIKLLNAGLNFKDILEGVQLGKSITLESLNKLKISTEDKPDLLYKVAYSSCENKKISRLISKVFELIGLNGFIDFEEYYSSETNVIYYNGFVLDRGLYDRRFLPKIKSITENSNEIVTLKETKVLVVHDIIYSQVYLSDIIDCWDDNFPNYNLLIIAEGFEEAIVEMAIDYNNNKTNECRIYFINIPFSNEDSPVDQYKDLAALTSTNIINSMYLPNRNDFGTIKSATIHEHNTQFKVFNSKNKDIDERINYYKKLIDEIEEQGFQITVRKRLAMLSQGAATIRVGGNSDVELQENYDRIVDALNACRNAGRSGVVPGCGMAFIHANRDIQHFIDAHPEQKLNYGRYAGLRLVMNAIKSPFFHVVNNSGRNAAFLTDYFIKKPKLGLLEGYNVKSNKRSSDIVNEGVVDSFQGVQAALIDSVHCMELLAKTECLVELEQWYEARKMTDYPWLSFDEVSGNNEMFRQKVKNQMDDVLVNKYGYAMDQEPDLHDKNQTIIL